jgi:hypothetical protein
MVAAINRPRRPIVNVIWFLLLRDFTDEWPVIRTYGFSVGRKNWFRSSSTDAATPAPADSEPPWRNS